MNPELKLSPRPLMVSRVKPPKLKTADRTISVQIENYSPATPTLTSPDTILIRKELSEKLLSAPDASQIFFMDENSTSPTSHDGCPYHSRRNSFRRSDTLDAASSSAYHLRKAKSFHVNDDENDIVIISKQRENVRNSFLFPQELVVTEQPQLQLQLSPQLQKSPSGDRRNCRMHRSFYDASRRVAISKKVIQATHSFGNDDIHPADRRKDIKKPTSATTSIENELYRSRSNSRNNRKDDETFVEFVNRQNSKKHSHKNSSHSLDQNYSFKRGARHAHSFYINSEPMDELQVPRSTFQTHDNSRKQFSASLKCRQKENLSTTKKSKSFITDVHHQPPFDTILTPSSFRRESKVYSAEELLKKNSKLILDAESPRSPYDQRKTSINFETDDMDYDAILRSYRQNRRKSSIVSSSKTKSSKKKSLTDDDGGADGDDEKEAQSNRKRKKIVCIIMTVFLSLVFASVFVVIITLTHSSSASNQRKSYTFSRESPIHHYNGITK